MTASDNPDGKREGPARHPRGRPYRSVRNGRSVSMLGIGIVIGAVLGAGVALLVAPQAGSDTRRLFTRRVERLRGNRGVWSKLGRELRRAGAAKRKAAEIEAKLEEIRLGDASAAST